MQTITWEVRKKFRDWYTDICVAGHAYREYREIEWKIK